MKLAFIGPIYGGMGPVEVPKNAPPMFCAVASDDGLFRGQFGVIESWYKAKVPVEFHLYQNGGHGFGLGNPNRTRLQISGLTVFAQGPGQRQAPSLPPIPIKGDTTHTLTTHFTLSSA
eukprot:gene33508-56143_t